MYLYKKIIEFTVCLLQIVIAFTYMSSSTLHSVKDYCNAKLDCAPGEHTMCKYRRFVRCPGSKVNTSMNFYEKRAILDEHNRLRQRFAGGFQKPFPTASNMMKMYWDNELEMIAQRWANQCKGGQDSCRRRKDNEYVGQNYFSMEIHRKNNNRTDAIRNVAYGWYSEVSWVDTKTNFSNQLINKFERTEYPNGSVGHFTQVVWADSYALGCGLLARQPHGNGMQNIDVICNYGPGGNVKGGSMYKIGNPGSKCPTGTWFSKRYPGLCTAEKDERKDVCHNSPSSSAQMISMVTLLLVLSFFTLALF